MEESCSGIPWAVPPSIRIGSDVLMNILRPWVCGRKPPEVKCASYHIILRIHTINVTYHLDVDLDPLAEVVCRISPLFGCSFSPFS